MRSRPFDLEQDLDAEGSVVRDVLAGVEQQRLFQQRPCMFDVK